MGERATAPRGTPYRQFGKRAFDLLVAIPALCLCALPMLGVALLVLVSMGPPILFIQRRTGMGGHPVPILKFRTMLISASGSDAERLTGVGRFLRRTSLDELPQLLNVVAGHMSLVGPRPLLEGYLPYYTREERVRFAVRPGMTGLAQVSGRNRLDWNARLALDVAYVERCSLLLDLGILWRTVGAVVAGTGFHADQGDVLPRLDEARAGLAHGPRRAPERASSSEL